MRKSISLKQKYDILQQLEGGQSQSSVAREMDMTRQTIVMIWKNRDKIIADFKKNPALTKRCRRKEFEHVDVALFEWFKTQRDNKVPLNGPILIEKAKDFAQQFGATEFKGSNGWLEKWKRRHNIILRVVSGEAASVDKQVIEDWMKEVWVPESKNYSQDEVYNCDETGLFWRLLPDKTLAFKNEVCSGGKLSKERVTVLLCCNMSGKDKLTPFVIGKSQRPRAFKGRQPREHLGVDYKANKNAWMTTILFTDWLLDVDKSMQHQKKKILLLMDNCSSHPGNVALKNVKLLFLPPNTTSVCQPLDQEIINNFKVKYRGQLLRRIIRKLDAKEDAKIDIWEAIYFLRRAWDEVSEACIAHCFRKAGFMHVASNVPFPEEEQEQLHEILPFTDYAQAAGVTLEDVGSMDEYLNVDDDVATNHLLSDEEIVSAVKQSLEPLSEPTPESDEEEVEVVPNKVSTQEFFHSLDNIKDWLTQRNLNTYAYMQNLMNLEDLAHHHIESTRRQNTMMDYFKPV